MKNGKQIIMKNYYENIYNLIKLLIGFYPTMHLHPKKLTSYDPQGAGIKTEISILNQKYPYLISTLITFKLITINRKAFFFV